MNVLIAYRLLLRRTKYSPVPRIEGTQRPTKMPASLSGGPMTPNHNEMDRRKEMNAADKMNKSLCLSMTFTIL